jgi:tetratricopeptide (TPR) repeat protein
VGIVVVLAVALSGKEPPAPPPAAAVPPKKAEPPPPPKVEAPKPAPTPPKPAEIAPPPSRPAPSPAPDPQSEFKAHLEARRAKAVERLEEAKGELAKERAEEEKSLAALRTRLAGKTLSLTLRDGKTIAGAAVRDYTLHDLKIEAGGSPRQLLWEELAPASILAAADFLFDPKSPRDQFDRGRLFIARRMWKDASAAFERAAQIGEGYASRVLEFSSILDRLLSDSGALRGSARRLGRDGLRVSYDFADPKQLEEWTPGLVLSGKAAVLEAKQPLRVYLRGESDEDTDQLLGFRGELNVDLKMSADAPVTFHLFAGPKSSYLLELGPAGIQLSHQAGPGAKKPLGKSDQAKLAAGKTHDVRILARDRKFTVLLDGKEAFSAADAVADKDAPLPHGAFGLSLEKGKLTIQSPLVLQGSVDPNDLDKRIGRVEVLLRRALTPELSEIREQRERTLADKALGVEKENVLSAQHPRFSFKTNQDLARASELKKALEFGHFGDGPGLFMPDQWLEETGEMIRKYPEIPWLCFIRANFNRERQNRPAALADVRKALETFPEFHEAHALHGEMLLDSGDADGALRAANRAIELRPDYVEAYTVRALATYTKTPQAIESYLGDLALARKLDPGHAEPFTWQRILKYQSRGPRDLGCRFDHETEHYRITTDISPEAAKRYGENLEAAWRYYRDTLRGQFRRDPRRKPRVAIFNTAENYYTYFELLSENRGEWTLGVFRPALNELVLFESLDLEETNHVLYHEAVHQFVHLLAGESPPFWYNEGIAEYAGGIVVKDGKVVATGALLRGRLTVIQWTLEVNSELPFKKIMCESPREFYSGPTHIKYAQAWSMVHFFHEYEKGKYKGLIQRYHDRILEGASPTQAFDEVFAKDVETLQKEWKEYVKKLKP